MKITIFLILISMLLLTNCDKKNQRENKEIKRSLPQEKLSYTIGGKTIAFKVSPDKFYVEFSPDKKAIVESVVNGKTQLLGKNVALITVKNLSGNFSAQSIQLQRENPNTFQKIAPVLIYKDGTEQICNGELFIELSNKEDLKDLLKGYNYTAVQVKYEANVFLVKIKNKSTQQVFTLISKLNANKKVVFAEPNFILFLKPQTASSTTEFNDPFFKSQWAINN